MPEHDPDKASARENLCRFLAACYYEPDAAFAEERLFDSMLAAASRIDPALAKLAKMLGEGFASQDLETLLVDYTRLFLGPPQPLARPHGAFWLTGETTLMQDATMAVLDLYQEGGFELDDEFREVPDHVAVELEFLYLLIFKRNEAQRVGSTGDLSAAEQLGHRFLREHLGAWIAPFTAAVKTGAEAPFYRDLAELTERFVRMEEARLGTAH
ncbi:MAG TPA: molecular chaperone TorD family protein [Ramlibacter sp.]|jgi:TorA maturation chaperone TorD